MENYSTESIQLQRSLGNSHKGFKYHFKRVVGGTKLIYEEFLTVAIQIGVLNARP